jgi:hypothetical protein
MGDEGKLVRVVGDGKLVTVSPEKRSPPWPSTITAPFFSASPCSLALLAQPLPFSRSPAGRSLARPSGPRSSTMPRPTHSRAPSSAARTSSSSSTSMPSQPHLLVAAALGRKSIR